MSNIANQSKVNLDDGSFSREFAMDKDEYEHILQLNELNEYIDFEIPKDAPEGKKMSDSALQTEQESKQQKQIPVDLNELFGGGKSG